MGGAVFRYNMRIVMRDAEVAAHVSGLRAHWAAALATEAHSDLVLAAQDGSTVPVHRCVLLPLSPALADLVKGSPPGSPAKVVLAGCGRAAVAAAMQLLYTGSCRLDPVTTEAAVRDVLAQLGVALPRASIQQVAVVPKEAGLRLPTRSRGRGQGGEGVEAMDDTFKECNRVYRNEQKKLKREEDQEEYFVEEIPVNEERIDENKEGNFSDNGMGHDTIAEVIEEVIKSSMEMVQRSEIAADKTFGHAGLPRR
jgi:hypothetical protein